MGDKLKAFCVDVLQDFIEENDYSIEQDRKQNYYVVVSRTRGIPKSLIRESWDKSAIGTEFENISLYM